MQIFKLGWIFWCLWLQLLLAEGLVPAWPTRCRLCAQCGEHSFLALGELVATAPTLDRACYGHSCWYKISVTADPLPFPILSHFLLPIVQWNYCFKFLFNLNRFLLYIQMTCSFQVACCIRQAFHRLVKPSNLSVVITLKAVYWCFPRTQRSDLQSCKMFSGGGDLYC